MQSSRVISAARELAANSALIALVVIVATEVAGSLAALLQTPSRPYLLHDAQSETDAGAMPEPVLPDYRRGSGPGQRYAALPTAGRP